MNTTAGPTPSPRASQRQREHQTASIILTENAAIMLILNAGQQLVVCGIDVRDGYPDWAGVFVGRDESLVHAVE